MFIESIFDQFCWPSHVISKFMSMCELMSIAFLLWASIVQLIGYLTLEIFLITWVLFNILTLTYYLNHFRSSHGYFYISIITTKVLLQEIMRLILSTALQALSSVPGWWNPLSWLGVLPNLVNGPVQSPVAGLARDPSPARTSGPPAPERTWDQTDNCENTISRCTTYAGGKYHVCRCYNSDFFFQDLCASYRSRPISIESNTEFLHLERIIRAIEENYAGVTNGEEYEWFTDIFAINSGGSYTFKRGVNGPGRFCVC